MRRVRRYLEATLDSPTLPRDLGTLFAGVRVGGWFLVLNVMLGIVLATTLYYAAVEGDPDWARASQQLGLGQFMACMLFLGLGGICTVLVPVRASGAVEGPRWGRYLDQLVLSGISPQRYFAGKVLAQNLFFGLMLAAALPYAVFCLSLGGTRVGYVLEGVAVLWIYTNVLTFATLASATFWHEVTGTLSVVLLAGLIYGVGLAPVPAGLAAVMPSHVLMVPIYEVTLEGAGGPPWGINELLLSVGGLEWRIGTLAFYLVGSALVVGVSTLLLLLGPVYCIVRENATFGEIVMPGDSGKKAVFRQRFALRRRSELAFFYENRSGWIKRWEALARYGGALLTLGLLAAVPFVFLHLAAGRMDADDFYGVNAFLWALAVLIGGAMFTSDRSTEWTRMGLGRRTYTAGVLDTFAFLLFFLFLTGLACVLPWLREALGMGKWMGSSSPRELAFAWELQHMAPLFGILMVEYYGMMRLLTMRSWLGGRAMGSGLLLLLGLWVAPFALAQIGTMVVKHLPDVERLLPYIGSISPIPYMVMHLDDHPSRAMREMFRGWLPSLAWVVHFALACLFVALAVRNHRSLDPWREGAFDESDGEEEETDAPPLPAVIAAIREPAPEADSAATKEDGGEKP